MEIVVREMPMEQVYRVDYEGTIVSGFVKRGESHNALWYKHHNDKRAKKGYLTKESAALALVIDYFEAEQRRLSGLDRVTAD